MGDFIDDFIQEYKKQPSLWQTSHPDFKNRKKRQDAYIKLIEVANKHNEAYNIERTKQKINNLRCAFRVQLKKYNEVKNNSKDGKEETYCPKRKYFESLMFLLNEETRAAKSDDLNKTKTIIRRNSEIGSRTRNKLLGRKKIDKEFEALTLDLKDELDSDDQFLTHSLDAEKENKAKTDSFEENEESFNLALIEEDENLSLCNNKEIDQEVFESIIEEDDQTNKEIQQTDFIKISKTSNPTITISRTGAITQQPHQTHSDKSIILNKHNSPQSQISDENIVLLQSSPTTSSVTIATPTSGSTAITTRNNFRQAQTKPVQHNAKFPTLSPINNKNARVVQVHSIKSVPASSLKPVQVSKQLNQSITSNSQKRLSTGLVAQSSTSSHSPLSSISSTSAQSNVTSTPIISQTVVLPKVTTSTQQITIRKASNQIQAKPALITETIIPSQHSNLSNSSHNNNEIMQSQTKKIRLDFDSSNLEKILSLACSKLKQEDNEDDFAVFGKMVTCKLKTMETDQALIAQRMITEILFDGQMKILQQPHSNSQKVVNSNLPQIFSQSLNTNPMTSLRQVNTNGQTYYISEMNGNTANLDPSSILSG